MHCCLCAWVATENKGNYCGFICGYAHLVWILKTVVNKGKKKVREGKKKKNKAACIKQWCAKPQSYVFHVIIYGASYGDGDSVVFFFFFFPSASSSRKIAKVSRVKSAFLTKLLMCVLASRLAPPHFCSLYHSSIVEEPRSHFGSPKLRFESIYLPFSHDQALHTLNLDFGKHPPPLTWESICDTTITHMWLPLCSWGFQDSCFFCCCFFF